MNAAIFGAGQAGEMRLLAILNREAESDIRKQIVAIGFHGEVYSVTEFRRIQNIRFAGCC
jgi:NCAIR mutase (PurE)-related protein